jgi:hypothetical protein
MGTIQDLVDVNNQNLDMLSRFSAFYCLPNWILNFTQEKISKEFLNKDNPRMQDI